MVKAALEAPDPKNTIQLCLVQENGVVWLRVGESDQKQILVGLTAEFVVGLIDALGAVGSGRAIHAHLFVPKTRPVKVNTFHPNLN